VYLNDTDTSLEWPAWVLLPVAIGYITQTRSFAHLGIAPLFIGEVTLGLLLLFWPEMIPGTWMRAHLVPSKYLKLAMWSSLFMAYGLLQLLRGLGESAYPKIALQNFGFNYYIAFLFAGMWLGERHRNLLPRFIWYLSWINGIYGIIYLLKLGAVVTDEFPRDNTIPFFGWPAGSAIVLLGLLAYGGGIRRNIIPVALNVFVLLGMQVRSEWFAFALAATLMSVLRGRFPQLVKVTAIVGGLFLIGVLVDAKVPGPARNRGVISCREFVGRAIAAVDEDTAAQWSESASGYSGTVSWRTEWWKELLKVAHEDTLTTLFGKGYGYPIWEHNHLIEGINPTPHNIFIYVLVYTGWVGVFIFYTLQLNLAWMLWKAYRASGQPFGLCLWVLLFVWAHSDNRLETPYGAIPFYVLLGMALTSELATTIAGVQDIRSSRTHGFAGRHA
jgi:O-Antigen ligase